MQITGTTFRSNAPVSGLEAGKSALPEEIELVKPPDPAQAAALANYLNQVVASVQEVKQAAPANGAAAEAEKPREIELPLPTGARVKTDDARLLRALELSRKRTFVLGADGKLTPAREDQANKVALRLAAFSLSSLEELEDAGVRILLVDPRQTPVGGYPGGKSAVNKDGSWPSSLGGYYNYGSNDLVMPEEWLDKPFAGEDVLLHELGHALSDARVSDTTRANRSKDDDPKLVGLHGDYCKRCGFIPGKDGNLGQVTNPSASWSNYACESPAEYLAEGVMVLQSNDKARIARFQSLDQEGFQYVTSFLAAQHEGTGFWDWLWKDEDPRAWRKEQG